MYEVTFNNRKMLSAEESLLKENLEFTWVRKSFQWQSSNKPVNV
jgi:hypothetical protein